MMIPANRRMSATSTGPRRPGPRLRGSRPSSRSASRSTARRAGRRRDRGPRAPPGRRSRGQTSLPGYGRVPERRHHQPRGALARRPHRHVDHTAPAELATLAERRRRHLRRHRSRGLVHGLDPPWRECDHLRDVSAERCYPPSWESNWMHTLHGAPRRDRRRGPGRGAQPAIQVLAPRSTSTPARPRHPRSILRASVVGASILVDAETTTRMGHGDVTTLASVLDRFRHALGSSDAAEIDSLLGELRSAADEEDLDAAIDAARRLRASSPPSSWRVDTAPKIKSQKKERRS